MSGQRAASSSMAAASASPASLSGAITPLNTSRNPGHTAAIRQVVDAFRNLHASVARFVLMLEDLLGDARSLEATTGQSLGELLSRLHDHAREIGFVRLDDLRFAIETARSAEQQRDLVFQVLPGSGTESLERVARGFQRLDATFVGLCVEHVLEQHDRDRASSGASA